MPPKKPDWMPDVVLEAEHTLWTTNHQVFVYVQPELSHQERWERKEWADDITQRWHGKLCDWPRSRFREVSTGASVVPHTFRMKDGGHKGSPPHSYLFRAL